MDAKSLSDRLAAARAVICSPPQKTPGHLDTILQMDHERTITIIADPRKPPLTLLLIYRSLLTHMYKVEPEVMIEDSMPPMSHALNSCLYTAGQKPCIIDFQVLGADLKFILQWTNVVSPRRIFLNFKYVPPMVTVKGEANLARYLFRLMNLYSGDPAQDTLVDCWVDKAFLQLARGSASERAAMIQDLDDLLGREAWVAGSPLSLANIACYCCILQSRVATANLPDNIQLWLKACDNQSFLGFYKGWLKMLLP